MSTATLHIGDVFAVMAGMPDASVDLVLTSPPFFALRSYLPADHPLKHLEIGSEPTPGEFIDCLLALTAEWGRLLTRHGSIVVELGDTYGGSGGAGGDYYSEDGSRAGQNKPDGPAARKRTTPKSSGPKYQNPEFDGGALRDRQADEAAGIIPSRLRTRRHLPGFPLEKSLMLLPQAYALSLSYGVNVLTGEPSPAGHWRVRNFITWARPNPSVGALGDKFRPASSFIIVATLASDRWFDLDAVRVPASAGTNPRTARGTARRATTGKAADDAGNCGNRSTLDTVHTTGDTAPPLDHWWFDDEDLGDEFDETTWLVPVHQYRGSHYATWPPKLLERPIESMAPRQVCTTCGEPSRRITAAVSTGQNLAKPGTEDDDPRQAGAVTSTHVPDHADVTTLGWSSCDCDGATPTTWADMATEGDWKAAGKPADWRAVYVGQRRIGRLAPTSTLDLGDPITNPRPGIVLDPFAGSGTTLAVATGRGRDAIGVDLDDRNEDLVRERVGMFLADVVYHRDHQAEPTGATT